MKRIPCKKKMLLFFCLFGILQLKSEITLSSQFPTVDTSFSYKSSIGGMLNNPLGVSFKTSLQEYLFLQTDIFYTVYAYPYREETSIYWNIYPSVESNTNIMYQKKLKETQGVALFWFIGGGITLGCCIIPVSGKAGVNALTGVECVIKKDKPLSLQIDFRPGYALLYTPNYKQSNSFLFSWPSKMPATHFNCLFTFTLRRTFIKK